MQWKAQPTTTKKNSKDTPNPTRDHNTDQMRRVPFDSKGERGLPTSHLTILLMKTKVTTPYKYCENKTPVYNEEKKKELQRSKEQEIKSGKIHKGSHYNQEIKTTSAQNKETSNDS